MPLVEFVARVGITALGLFIIGYTMLAAIKTYLLPRAAGPMLIRFVFRSTRWMFGWRLARAKTYEERDAAMAFYAPVSLVIVPFVLLFAILVGYMLVFYGTLEITLFEAFDISGSSLLTLGFTKSGNFSSLMLEFSEAAIGMILIALVIGYFPTMYSAFQKREALVNLLQTRAGDPLSAETLISRVHQIRGLSVLGDLWPQWEVWFAELEESHTSLTALVFFRSPVAGRSWVTAAGVILDGAALTVSSVDTEHDPQADLCIRAGYLALRRIADFFAVIYDSDPKADDLISISQEEFNEVYDNLLAAGVPMKPDREQCWRDYAGWRINYDRVLIALAALTLAPYAPWVSDRSIPMAMLFKPRRGPLGADWRQKR